MQIRKCHFAAAALACGLAAAVAAAETMQDEKVLKADQAGVISTNMNAVGMQTAADSTVLKAIDEQAQADVDFVRGGPGRGGRGPGRGGHEGGHGGWHPGHPHDGWHPRGGGHHWPAYHHGWGWGARWHWGWAGIYPVWWVWATVPYWVWTAEHPSCVAYYDGYYRQCLAATAETNVACHNECLPGDFDCHAQCDYNRSLGDTRCRVDFDQRRHAICHVP